MTIYTTQANVAADMIDFGVGQPGNDLLPLDLMRRAATLRLSQSDAGLLNYGYEQGDGYLRLALAEFLQKGYGIPVTDEELLITAGGSQALDLICTRLGRPGGVIFVEEPTYFLALDIFADHGLTVVGIPTDEQGLRMEALEERLKEKRQLFLYTIPTYQNPTGTTLPLARRQRLVELSQEYGFTIVADEVYQLLNYSGTPPPLPLAHWISSGTVISVSTFSKILAPGLRLGWIQTEPQLMGQLMGSGLIGSGGALNQFTASLVATVLQQGWQDEYLTWLKAVYWERVQAMQTAIQEQLGEWVTFQPVEGGFFFWLALPPAVETAVLLPQAAVYNVGFQPGSKFSTHNGLQNWLRLSFAYYPTDQLVEGVARLQKLLSKALGSLR